MYADLVESTQRLLAELAYDGVNGSAAAQSRIVRLSRPDEKYISGRSENTS